MPLNHEAIRRRRNQLGISQANLAIMSGVTLTNIGRLESGRLPQEGAHTGIDVVMRLAEALRVDVNDLLISPVGNRYERAVRFAAEHHSEVAGHPTHRPWHERDRRQETREMRRLAGMPTMPNVRPRQRPSEPDWEAAPADGSNSGAEAAAYDDSIDRDGMSLKEWVRVQREQRAKHGRSGGVPITEEVIEDLVVEAEAGYDFTPDPSSE